MFLVGERIKTEPLSNQNRVLKSKSANLAVAPVLAGAICQIRKNIYFPPLSTGHIIELAARARVLARSFALARSQCDVSAVRPLCSARFN
jgi:hypothetical protein